MAITMTLVSQKQKRRRNDNQEKEPNIYVQVTDECLNEVATVFRNLNLRKNNPLLQSMVCRLPDKYCNNHPFDVRLSHEQSTLSRTREAAAVVWQHGSDSRIAPTI